MIDVLIAAVIVGPLLIAGALIFLAVRRMHAQADAAHARREDFRARQQRAVWASATIVSVRRASLREDARGREKVELTLKVQPPNGASYSAHAAWNADFNALALLRAGETVSVKIDAGDPKIIYPNMTGLEYWAWR